MKKYIVFALMLALPFISAGQLPRKHTEAVADQLLKKSRTQNQIGTATAVTGGTLMLAGGIMWLSEFGKGWGEPGYSERTANTGETLFYTGAGLTLVSTIFLETAKRNRSRARAIAAAPYLKMESTLQPQLPGIGTGVYPSLAWRIGL